MFCLVLKAPGAMQSQPLPPTSSVAQQHFQTPAPAMGQPQMHPAPQAPHMASQNQMSPPQSPLTNMLASGQPMGGQSMAGPPMGGQSMAGPPMGGQSMTGPPMAGMNMPFPGPPPSGQGAFQQHGTGPAAPSGYPQQSGNKLAITFTAGFFVVLNDIFFTCIILILYLFTIMSELRIKPFIGQNIQSFYT